MRTPLSKGEDRRRRERTTARAAGPTDPVRTRREGSARPAAQPVWDTTTDSLWMAP